MDFNKNNQSSRINLDNYKSEPFQLFENLNVENNKFENLTGNMQSSKVSTFFFSQENVDYLQTQIISRIYKKSNKMHKIGRQSEDELIIVMRSIYLQHGKNVDTNIDTQINILNELVLDYCVDNVFSNLIAHFEYINDLTKDQPVLDKPISTNIKGDKSLQPKHFF